MINVIIKNELGRMSLYPFNVFTLCLRYFAASNSEIPICTKIQMMWASSKCQLCVVGVVCDQLLAYTP